jgi:hypothetical protein
MKKIIFNKLFLILFLTLPFSLSAYDFGLVLNANGGYENGLEEDNTATYKVDILPRFSTLIGDNGELIVSAGFSAGKEKEDESYYVPELLRTELNIRFGNSGIRAGRIIFSDPLSIVASGLFDGIRYHYNTDGGSFYAGVWYTGLLYKGKANIIMTVDDQIAFDKPLEYEDFSGTYFASKRVISSVGWEHPSIGEFLQLSTAFVGQTDLNDADTKYHSQYLIIKAGIPVKNLLMEFGGSVEFAQTITEESVFNTAFAGDVGLFLLFPSAFNSRLLFKGTIAGGRKDDSMGAFIPITSREYGYVLRTKITGLSVFSMDYSSKFSNSFSGSLTASYFVRNDLGTFKGYPIAVDSEGYFLGPEASAQITWSPASDLQFNFGGGAFFPSLGNAGSDEKVLWRVNLTLILLII